MSLCLIILFSNPIPTVILLFIYRIFHLVLLESSSSLQHPSFPEVGPPELSVALLGFGTEPPINFQEISLSHPKGSDWA